MNATTALAVLLAVASAAGYAAGAVAQERVAARRAPGGPASRGFGWWLAVGGNLVGAVLHVLALRYGALSVVQPIGALTLVFALPLGALAIGRRARHGELLGAGLTVAGLGVLLSLTPSGPATASLSTGGLYGLAALGVLGTVAALWVARRTRRPVARGLVLGVAAGVTFALASVFTRVLTVRVAERGWDSLVSPATVLLVAAAAAGVLFSQAAYRAGGLAVPLTAVTLANPLAAAGVGLALLGEGFTGGTTGALVVAAAAAVTVRGVLLLISVPASTGEPARSGGRPAASPSTAPPDGAPAVTVPSAAGPARQLAAAHR